MRTIFFILINNLIAYKWELASQMIREIRDFIIPTKISFNASVIYHAIIQLWNRNSKYRRYRISAFHQNIRTMVIKSIQWQRKFVPCFEINPHIQFMRLFVSETIYSQLIKFHARHWSWRILEVIWISTTVNVSEQIDTIIGTSRYTIRSSQFQEIQPILFHEIFFRQYPAGTYSRKYTPTFIRVKNAGSRTGEREIYQVTIIIRVMNLSDYIHKSTPGIPSFRLRFIHGIYESGVQSMLSKILHVISISL